MEKRALLASALSIVVLMLYFSFFAPVPPPVTELPLPEQAAPPGQTATDTLDAPTRQETLTPTVGDNSMPPAERIEATAAEEFRVLSGRYDLRFTNEGGRISWWRLQDYLKEPEVLVELIPSSARESDVLPLQVEIPGNPEATATLATALHTHKITDIRATDASGLGPGKQVSFKWADGQGLEVEKRITVSDEVYEVLVEVEVTRNDRPVPSRIVWASGLGEPSGDNTRRMWHVQGQVVIETGVEVKRETAADISGERLTGIRSGEPFGWAGLESTYFVSLLLPAPGGEFPPDVVFTQRADLSADDAEPFVTAAIRAEGPTKGRIFVGPKDYHLLESKGYGLEKVIDFSNYALLYVITKYLFLALTEINQYIGNYGLSIIILTIAVRLVFFPITYRSMITMRKTSKKMAKVQPKVRAIQERYKKEKRTMDSQKEMNDKIMAIYKREGVNPMSNVTGCLPLLLQMPIFIGFYNLLAVTIEVRQAPFIGWITDLSSKDPYYITPVLMGVSWLLQQAMTGSAIPDPMQRRMMMLMPLMFTFMMLNMPSGLVLYWLTSNIIGMGQQYLINTRADAITAQGQGSPGAEILNPKATQKNHEDPSVAEKLRELEELTNMFLSKMELELVPKVSEEEEAFHVDLEGTDAFMLLEKKAGGLEALQMILSKVASSKLSIEKRIIVDCEGHRKGRDQEIGQVALKAAEKALRLKEPVELSPMNSYERRLVHLALRDEEGVESMSEGEGFLKTVVVRPV